MNIIICNATLPLRGSELKLSKERAGEREREREREREST